MQAYREPPQVNKPVTSSTPAVPFALTPDQARERKHLDDWTTRALAAIKPWLRDLRTRLARAWTRNGHHGTLAHCKERGDIERQLAGDLDRLRGTSHFIDCARHSPRLRASYMTLIDTVHRLQEGGDWWKPRTYVDRETGEVVETLYLPEDTWSAAGALHYCVAFLVRLLAAVPRTTERRTPRYNPREAAKDSGGRMAASRDWDARAAFGLLAKKYGGPQPDLPAAG